MTMKTTVQNKGQDKVEIPNRIYFRIGDVAELLGVKPYVLRYWESEFPIIHPEKSNSGQRVYRRNDVENLLMIKRLLYEERYSIEGAKKRIKDLRKEGDLKDFREGAVAGFAKDSQKPAAPSVETASAASAVTVSVDPAKLRELAEEIRKLCHTPITDLFYD